MEINNTSMFEPISSTVYNPKEYDFHDFRICHFRVGEKERRYKIIYNVEKEKEKEFYRKINNKISN